MHAARQLSPSATTPEPVISSLGATTTEPTGQGACALQREKPTQLIWRTAPAHHNLRKPSHSNKEQAQPKKEIQTRLEYGFGGGGLVALHIHWCSQAFFRGSRRGLLFVLVHGLLTAVASLVPKHGLQAHRPQELQCAGSRMCSPR